MQKLLLTGAAAGTLLLAPIPSAMADEQIQAQFSNRYTNPEVTIDQGERLTFRNNDSAKHDVTAMGLGPDNRPLFATPLIGQGEEAFVEGSQYLTTGAYDYICSIHSNMKGRITVNSAGTPVPRPGATPPPAPGTGDTTKPKVSFRIVKATRRSLTIRYSLDEGGRVTFTAKAGSKTVGKESASQGAAGKSTLKIALKGVKRGAKLVVSARAKDLAGNIGKRTARVTAR